MDDDVGVLRCGPAYRRIAEIARDARPSARLTINAANGEPGAGGRSRDGRTHAT